MWANYEKYECRTGGYWRVEDMGQARGWVARLFVHGNVEAVLQHQTRSATLEAMDLHEGKD
jgi:hypothetical protein